MCRWRETTIQIIAGEKRLAVLRRAESPGKQLILPGQWDGISMGDAKKAGARRPTREPLCGGTAAAVGVRAVLGRDDHPMIAVASARQCLEKPRLTQAAEVVESLLEAAAQKELAYAEFLVDLPRIKARARRERHLATSHRLVPMPFRNTLEDLNFSFQSPIDKRQVREAGDTGFLGNAADVVLRWDCLGWGEDPLGSDAGTARDRTGHGVYFARTSVWGMTQGVIGLSTGWTASFGCTWRLRC